MTAQRPERRSQAERRTETIARLVEATIESILEVGYHRTSLGEVCARSGVSKGGLFRHFDSRLDLVVAAARTVADRHLAAFDAVRAAGGVQGIEEMLLFTRTRARDQSNAVWFELLVAARTDADLRELLAPVADSLYAAIESRALESSFGSGQPEELVRLVTTSVLHLFDGEAIIRHTYPRPDLEEARLDALGQLVNAVVGRP